MIGNGARVFPASCDVPEQNVPACVCVCLFV